jgi:Holliday junction resolvasome RuvABC endonuclease subunit
VRFFERRAGRILEIMTASECIEGRLPVPYIRTKHMKIIGIKNGKDSFGWVVIEGTARGDAAVLERQEVVAPVDARAKQLAWVRREVIEVLTRHNIDLASIRLAESAPAGAPNFARAEMDGVVQAALAERGISVAGYKSGSIRSAFGKTKTAADSAIDLVPCVVSSAKIRRDQVIVAVAQLAS